MEGKTKLGFSVIQIVEIPFSYLRKGVLKEMSGRELYTDTDEGFSEKIYNGEIFEVIACEQEEMSEDSPLKMSAEDLKQVDELAGELGEFELVRVNMDSVVKESSLDKMKELFLNSGDDESEEVELDNLDQAKLVREGKDVEVENKYGTRFPISELSNEEVKIFIYLLEH